MEEKDEDSFPVDRRTVLQSTAALGLPMIGSQPATADYHEVCDPYTGEYEPDSSDPRTFSLTDGWTTICTSQNCQGGWCPEVECSYGLDIFAVYLGQNPRGEFDPPRCYPSWEIVVAWRSVIEDGNPNGETEYRRGESLFHEIGITVEGTETADPALQSLASDVNVWTSASMDEMDGIDEGSADDESELRNYYEQADVTRDEVYDDKAALVDLMSIATGTAVGAVAGPPGAVLATGISLAAAGYNYYSGTSFPSDDTYLLDSDDVPDLGNDVGFFHIPSAQISTPGPKPSGELREFTITAEFDPVGRDWNPNDAPAVPYRELTVEFREDHPAKLTGELTDFYEAQFGLVNPEIAIKNADHDTLDTVTVGDPEFEFWVSEAEFPLGVYDVDPHQSGDLYLRKILLEDVVGSVADNEYETINQDFSLSIELDMVVNTGGPDGTTTQDIWLTYAGDHPEVEV